MDSPPSLAIGLIGCAQHWRAYSKLIGAIPGVKVAAVAPGSPAENPAPFDKAPGADASTRRYDDPRRMLDKERLNLVQVSTVFEEMGRWCLEAAARGIPTASEKPVATDLGALRELFDVVEKGNVPFHAVQGMQGHAAFAAAEEAVRAGRIGTPYASYHQKSYRWAPRPPSWKERRTFPGIVPWVGIHALAWMHRTLGDCFTEAAGWEGGALHPEFPACATQAGLVFRMSNGGFALLSMDYLRPEKAPTHGDERMRVAGSLGVIDVLAVENRCALITAGEGPVLLDTKGPVTDPYVRFALSLKGGCEPPVPRREIFRVTEIALLAQRAVETGETVALAPSALPGG